MDFLVPLPKTESGNEYILVMVDTFTKWMECLPFPSQTVEVTAFTAVNDFFSRLSTPSRFSVIRGEILRANYLVRFVNTQNSANCLMLGCEVHIPATVHVIPHPPLSNEEGEECCSDVDRNVLDLNMRLHK